jgi:phosphinothricin acetyltransferase
VRIRPLTAADWPWVAEIYRQGIETGNATFELKVPSWDVWDQSHRTDCRLVAEDVSALGWGALTPVSERCVYGGVADVSVYVDAGHRGQRIGDLLLKALIADSGDVGIWTLQAGVFPENHASLGLHLSNGFRQVGVRERIGEHHGIWRDVLLLERRS